MSRDQADIIEGRNEVIEAFRAGRTIDRIMVLDGSTDGPLQTVKREAKKREVRVDYVSKKRLDEISPTGMHQGVIAYTSAYEYVGVADILNAARKKKENPFIFLLDNIEDPHNLGAIIRTANAVGAHGVVIPRNRATGLTSTVVRCSSGAVNYTPVARVANLSQTIEALKKEGLWFVCADMSGESLYEQNLTGPLGIVIGSEGNGVGRLVKSKCDFVTRIPMMGEIESLNSSVAASVIGYEALRQRLDK